MTVVRRIADLSGGDWRLGSVAQQPFGDVNDFADARDWLPAQVPGDVRLDLLRAGKITDPFFGTNNKDSQWVDACDWWYTRSLNLPLEPDERAFLVFEGIDYLSAVYVNGRQVGRHAGMFSRQVYEIRPEQTVQDLAIRIWGSDALPKLHLNLRQKLWKRLIAPMFPPSVEPFPDRYATVKCQMQFGWDFAPRLRTCGIWDEAYVVVTRSVWIQDVWVRSQLGDERKHVRLAVTLTLDSDRSQRVRAMCHVQSKNLQEAPRVFPFDMDLQRGKQTRELAIDLENVRLWDPWDRGEPNLYEVQVEILGANSEPLDVFSTTHGIRSIELVSPPGSPRDAEPWTLVINGVREFIRGANWVPLDAIPGRLTRADYAARLAQVREASVNWLRVWGGGLREKRAFYDLCDEMGILVWQEFPFAGAVLDRFPSDRAFIESVGDEASAIVCALRNHPSLVVWCGGNEFNTRGNRHVVKELESAVTRLDGTRPFKPASPSHDESHYWRVWHRKANLADYRKDPTPFLSEFGLQSVPAFQSFECFMPRDMLFPPNAVWVYHHAELDKLERYARPQLGGRDPRDVKEFIDATQQAQALGIQIAIEHMRRRKGRTAGVAVWQFNDAWPAISWSLVDYYGIPKQAYAVMRRLYSPLLVSFDYPFKRYRDGDVVRGDLWLINDLIRAFDGIDLRAFLNDRELFTRRVSLAPDSAERLDAFEVRLGAGANTLRFELRDHQQVSAVNEYDLNRHDVGGISPLVTFGYNFYDRLMR